MHSKEPKYLLIQHGDSPSDPWVFQVFANKEDRQRATAQAIFGEDVTSDEMSDHAGEWASYLYTLEEDGLLTFEGDPGIEWRTGWVEIP